MRKKKEQRDYYVSCIVVAGGSGKRMGAGINKIFLEILGVPVLAHTLRAVDGCEDVDEIILVTREEDLLGCKDIIEEFQIGKVKTITLGGKERQDSVKNGLREVSERADIVLVHDAARPLVEADAIRDVVLGAREFGAASVGVPLKSTIKQIDGDGFLTGTVDRGRLFENQTPQGFSKDLIERAYAAADADGAFGTDDCALVERLGVRIKAVIGSGENLKITTSEDLPIAEKILERRGLEGDGY